MFMFTLVSCTNAGIHNCSVFVYIHVHAYIYIYMLIYMVPPFPWGTNRPSPFSWAKKPPGDVRMFRLAAGLGVCQSLE